VAVSRDRRAPAIVSAPCAHLSRASSEPVVALLSALSRPGVNGPVARARARTGDDDSSPITKAPSQRSQQEGERKIPISTIEEKLGGGRPRRPPNWLRRDRRGGATFMDTRAR